MIRRLQLDVAFVVILCSLGFGATPRIQAPAQPAAVDELLDRAAANALTYDDIFSELTTNETYTIVTYDDEGELAQRRVFVSGLVIHDLTRSPGRVPYRHVLAVDGRQAGDLKERVLRLSKELDSARSAEDERELLSRESQRFGLVPKFNGYALRTYKFVYDDRFRHAFDVTIVGSEMTDAGEMIIVEYRQIQDISAFNYNVRDLSEAARAYLRGRLWIEASTGALWRDESAIFVEGLPSFSEDPPLLEYELQYMPSPYGILTPERFEFTTYSGRSFILSERTTQDFGPFERFDVDVRLSPVDGDNVSLEP